MCFEAPTMASSAAAEAMQFLLSPRETKSNGVGIAEVRCCGSSKAAEPSLELVDYYSLPEFLKHNEFIINYYRSEWPLKQTIRSIFAIHNETINIWTHLIGFFIFLVLTGYAASVFPMSASSINAPPMQSGNSSNTFIHFYGHLLMHTFQRGNLHIGDPETSTLQPVPRWPFYLYLAGAMFCLLTSSACHLLSCHSARSSYIMLRLDFAGISGLIVSSFYPLVYYTFACNPFFRGLYLSSITVFGVAAIIVSLMPVFDSPQFRPVRAVLFACMAASGLVPIAHKMLAFGDRPEAVVTTGYEAAMGMFYGLGVVVYAARVPERWLPGRFDLAGHSHQLFHVLVVAGAYTHYLASSVYLGWREVEGC